LSYTRSATIITSLCERGNAPGVFTARSWRNRHVVMNAECVRARTSGDIWLQSFAQQGDNCGMDAQSLQPDACLHARVASWYACDGLGACGVR